MRSLGLIVVLLALGAVIAAVGGRPRASDAVAPERASPRPAAAVPPAPPEYVAVRAETELVESAALVVDQPSFESPFGAGPVPVRGSTLGVDALGEPAPDVLAGWGPSPAPSLDPRPFSEAHWQGLELIPKTAPISRSLRLPADLDGVVLDDVSLPADLHGFVAGDLVLAVDGVPTPNLLAFVRATDRIRDRREAELEVWRQGGKRQLVLVALFERLGTANGETPPMIAARARSPHQYQGACTSCHRIGNDGTLATDQGDPTVGSPPAVVASSTPPHRTRGPCSSCHRILP